VDPVAGGTSQSDSDEYLDYMKTAHFRFTGAGVSSKIRVYKTKLISGVIISL
jgi:hypothetical protein